MELIWVAVSVVGWIAFQVMFLKWLIRQLEDRGLSPLWVLSGMFVWLILAAKRPTPRAKLRRQERRMQRRAAQRQDVPPPVETPKRVEAQQERPVAVRPWEESG